MTDKKDSNIPNKIKNLVEKNLHRKTFHPIEIIKKLIYDYFGESFETFDGFSPYVSVEDNFDKLLIPKDHPARTKSDTYYLDENTVLRTHTSAHQHQLLSKGYEKFLVTGDVYRKDEIDKNHYPVFHQMEGVCLVDDNDDPEIELKKVLRGLIDHLFPNCEYRINDDYFPFTEPSFEVEVYYQERWLEVLGCGVIKQEILKSAKSSKNKGWAFGLGLERLAMILFKIPDIRYFWSEDSKFFDQFNDYKIVTFKPYSTLKPITLDISISIPTEQIIWKNLEKWKWAQENEFYECCRECLGHNVETVTRFDKYYNKTRNAYSLSYHIVYSSTDSNMKNPAVFQSNIAQLHNQLCILVVENLGVALR